MATRTSTRAAVRRGWPAAALAVVLSTLAPAPSPARAADVRVYAAASLTTALTALAEAYEEDGHGRVTLVTGSSGALAGQIAQGAPADMYLSADRGWIDFLVENGDIAADAVRPFASNRLVLIAPSASELDAGPGGPDALAAALRDRRIVLADPAVAPLGAYARQSLEALGLWPILEPNLVSARDATAALAYVDRNAVDAGVVYASDAALADVRVLATLPADSHDPVLYLAAPVAGGDAAGADRFLTMLIGKDGVAVLERLGFAPLPADAPL